MLAPLRSAAVDRHARQLKLLLSRALPSHFVKCDAICDFVHYVYKRYRSPGTQLPEPRIAMQTGRMIPREPRGL